MDNDLIWFSRILNGLDEAHGGEISGVQFFVN